MNPKLLLCLALVAFNLSSHARVVQLWSDAELMAASDLVVVGRPIKVEDLDETNSLGFVGSKSFQPRFRGVETTFKVSEVLKGTPASDQIVLHHYRFEWGSPPNGPTLMEFIPGDTNEYLLYLKNDGTNRYAPTFGQIAPVFQIKQIKPPPANSSADTNSLRVVVIPSRTEVRVKEKFKVALRVENTTTTNQTVRVWSCSWDEEWKASNANISWIGWDCTKNNIHSIEIPPGGAYTNELEMLIPEPISEKALSFRMGFTPIDSEKTFWSDAVSISVTPQAAAVAKAELKFVKVDSEETNSQDGYGENAVDGNPNTYWHTQWQGTSPGLPHEIIIELLPPSVIKGFTYLPRQDESDHGTIKDYEFYVSDDGRNFGQPVKKGTFEPGKEEKIETFEPIKCRFIKLRAISEINGLPWTSAAEIGVIQSGEDASVNDYRLNQATSLLAEFKKSKSIDQLESAFRVVERIPPPGGDKTVPWSVARQEQAKMWLSLLATIDQNIDATFDVNDRSNWPALNVTPPAMPEGIPYFSGMDPKDIKDPEARARYEAAIKRNKDKAARDHFQIRLHNIDQLANIGVERFLRWNYTTSKEDQSELENLMQQAKLSPDRAQKLKALFESTNPAGNNVDNNLTKQIPDTQTKHVPLDFLADIPSLNDVSLKMSEAELLDIIHQQKLDYTHGIYQADSTYYVYPKEHVVVIITFRQGHCGGIQRMMD